MTKKGNQTNYFPGEIDIFLILGFFFYNKTFRDFFKSGPEFWHLKDTKPRYITWRMKSPRSTTRI